MFWSAVGLLVKCPSFRQYNFWRDLAINVNDARVTGSFSLTLKTLQYSMKTGIKIDHAMTIHLHSTGYFLGSWYL